MAERASWRVCKRDGNWRVYDRGVWHDTFDSLPEAHSYALAASLSDVLYSPGGLSYLRHILDAADWWAAYVSAAEEIGIVNECPERRVDEGGFWG